MNKTLKSASTNTKAAKSKRRTQAERSERTRSRVLEASAELLRQKGVAGLRTLEVASRAGVSQGAQFHHFPNKRALLFETLKWINDRSLAVSRQRADKRHLNSEDLISDIISDAAEFYFSDSFFAELAVGLSGEDEREVLGEIRDMTREARITVDHAWRDSLQKAGLSADLASDVVSLTFSVVRGYAVRTLLKYDRVEFERLFKLWQEIVLSYITQKNLGK